MSEKVGMQVKECRTFSSDSSDVLTSVLSLTQDLFGKLIGRANCLLLVSANLDVPTMGLSCQSPQLISVPLYPLRAIERVIRNHDGIASNL
jgi:hypothetical protein